MSLSGVLHGGPVTPDEIARVREALVFSTPELARKLVRFWILLVLSSAIATFGLLADSVATVIGAMIIAPLMLPIMGLAFGISLGDKKAIGVSLLVGLGGMVTAVGVGWLLAAATTVALDPEQVGQIMSRTSPKLIDMLAALATGLAGAFAIGRKDVSDTLPGVAIAISLVPPLANAGILLSAGRTSLALGSVLLFLTNYLAILLTGSLVFGLMGFPRAVLVGRSRVGKAAAVVMVLIMFVGILAPLGIQSFLVWADHTITGRTSDATVEWLKDSGYSLVSVKLEKGNPAIEVVISGSGSLPPQERLREALVGKVGGLHVMVNVIPSDRFDLDTR